MAKRRTRTNKNVPAKGRLKDMADQLWSLAVRADWDWKCAVCGFGKVEAHHLIPRQHEKTRYDLMNGLALCSRHHQFDPDISPHQNAAGWMIWLANNQPGRHHWYSFTIENGLHKQFNGTENASYYCDIIRDLKQYVTDEDFVRIVGQKFSKWLESTDG